jgi:hypothetical protein
MPPSFCPRALAAQTSRSFVQRSNTFPGTMCSELEATMARVSEVLGFVAGLLLIVGALTFASVGGESGFQDPAHLVD